MSNLSEVMPAMPMQTQPTNTALSSGGIFQFGSFTETMQAAQILSNSSLVPKDYRAFIPEKEYGKIKYDAQGNVIGENNPNAAANCLIALNMANRMGYDPLMIMQNLHIIEGRPAWSSQFIIAAINACGKFSPLRFEIVSHGMTNVEYTTSTGYGKNRVTDTVKTQIDNISCIAWAIEKATGERIESAKIDMVMAIKEGWYGKNGSKWQTMPDQMLRYRAAAFFGRIYAPEILMGIYSADEVRDFIDVTPEPQPAVTPAPPVQQQIPCYDINPLLTQISAIETMDQVRAMGQSIKALSENPKVNLCGDDLPTLRDALTNKKSQLQANALESVWPHEATAFTEKQMTEQAIDSFATPVSDESLLDQAKALESELTKAINVMTLEDANDVKFFLERSRDKLAEVIYTALEATFNSKYADLEAEAQA